MRKVVIADDHGLVRQAIIGLFAEIGDVEIVAEAADGLSAIAAVKQHLPSLLVLDAAMPLARGVEVFADVRRWSPETRVVLLTGFTSAGLLSDWINAGVDGVLLKSCNPEEMKSCFSSVLQGSQYVANAVLEILRNSDGGKSLTNREREVMALVVSGNTNVEIGERLHISVKTVEKHRASLMSKLGVRSVADLMVVAVREGWLDEHKQL
ncbi:MAG: response regulator transcription factor [Parvularculaceae bacterium]